MDALPLSRRSPHADPGANRPNPKRPTHADEPATPPSRTTDQTLEEQKADEDEAAHTEPTHQRTETPDEGAPERPPRP